MHLNYSFHTVHAILVAYGIQFLQLNPQLNLTKDLTESMIEEDYSYAYAIPLETYHKNPNLMQVLFKVDEQVFTALIPDCSNKKRRILFLFETNNVDFPIQIFVVIITSIKIEVYYMGDVETELLNKFYQSLEITYRCTLYRFHIALPEINPTIAIVEYSLEKMLNITSNIEDAFDYHKTKCYEFFSAVILKQLKKLQISEQVSKMLKYQHLHKERIQLLALLQQSKLYQRQNTFSELEEVWNSYLYYKKQIFSEDPFTKTLFYSYYPEASLILFCSDLDKNFAKKLQEVIIALQAEILQWEEEFVRKKNQQKCSLNAIKYKCMQMFKLSYHFSPVAMLGDLFSSLIKPSYDKRPNYLKRAEKIVSGLIATGFLIYTNDFNYIAIVTAVNLSSFTLWQYFDRRQFDDQHAIMQDKKGGLQYLINPYFWSAITAPIVISYRSLQGNKPLFDLIAGTIGSYLLVSFIPQNKFYLQQNPQDLENKKFITLFTITLGNELGLRLGNEIWNNFAGLFLTVLLQPGYHPSMSKILPMVIVMLQWKDFFYAINKEVNDWRDRLVKRVVNLELKPFKHGIIGGIFKNITCNKKEKFSDKTLLKHDSAQLFLPSRSLTK